MSFGGFVENNSGGGGGVRNIGEISYNNERMPFGSFSQPRLVTSPALAKSMFNSPGLSLALVSTKKDLVFLFVFVLFVFLNFVVFFDDPFDLFDGKNEANKY